ncbi:MAG: hypothetical protein ACRBF0_15415 [Calditrichia bacterium]
MRRTIIILILFTCFGTGIGNEQKAITVCVWQSTLWDEADTMLRTRSEILLKMRSDSGNSSLTVELAMLDYKLASLYLPSDPKKALHFLNDGLEQLITLESPSSDSEKLLKLGLLYGLWANKIPLDQANFAIILSEMSTIAYESKKISKKDPFMSLQKGKSYFWWRPQDGVLALTKALNNLTLLEENATLRQFVEEESLVWLIRCYNKLGDSIKAEEAYQRLLTLNSRYSEKKEGVFEIASR